MLGLYMFDYLTNDDVMPPELMEEQLKVALELLHSGRVHDVIFLKAPLWIYRWLWWNGPDSGYNSIKMNLLVCVALLPPATQHLHPYRELSLQEFLELAY